MKPPIIKSTWWNYSVGFAGVSKWLVRFLISDSLVALLLSLLFWGVASEISSHMPLVLHLVLEGLRIKFPLNFNSLWLEDPDYCSLVQTV